MYEETALSLASGDFFLSADNLCKQFGPKSGPEKNQQMTTKACEFSQYVRS